MTQQSDAQLYRPDHTERPERPNRYEGRLFSEDGRLCLVLDVNTESGLARVSSRVQGMRQVVDMPVSEVALRLASPPEQNLDVPVASSRVVQKSDGWFFVAREGLKGPYLSDVDAEQALTDYIQAAQRS